MLSEEQLLSGVVLPIDKPRQWSSFQVVNKVKSTVRRLYGLKKFKIGHAGTLDPLASGLLLVCIGRATKQIDQLQQGEKRYIGTMVLGATTPCFDLERPINKYLPASHITLDDVKKASRHFVGEIEQTPPIFSAVKIDGIRAYQHARNEEADTLIKAKKVSIYSFDITHFSPGDPHFVMPTIAHDAQEPKTQLYRNPLGTVPQGLPQVEFVVRCGKGTYIRSLARDVGDFLGCGAFLSDLRRVQVGQYDISQALDLEEIEKNILALSL